MDEYISREETIKRIKECYCTGCNSYNGVKCRACGTGDAIDVIEDAPSCDVVAVRHGRWVDNHCTACGMMPMGDEMWKLCDFEPPRFEKFMDYCPSCGAKMDRGNCRSYNKPKTGWCEVHLDCEHPNGFCSYGERKDGTDG